MRIRIVQRPAQPSLDGIRLDRFELGYIYDVGPTIGSLFLAEGWAEPVADNLPPLVEPPVDATSQEPVDPDNPPNLRREIYPPYLDRLELDRVADLERRRRSSRRKSP